MNFLTVANFSLLVENVDPTCTQQEIEDFFQLSSIKLLNGKIDSLRIINCFKIKSYHTTFDEKNEILEKIYKVKKKMYLILLEAHPPPPIDPHPCPKTYKKRFSTNQIKKYQPLILSYEDRFHELDTHLKRIENAFLLDQKSQIKTDKVIITLENQQDA